MLKTTINLTFGESSLPKWIINGGVGECCGGGGGGEGKGVSKFSATMVDSLRPCLKLVILLRG